MACCLFLATMEANMPRWAVVIAGIMAVTVLLVGAGIGVYNLIYPTFTHRIRVTIDVRVGGQLRSGSGVIEVAWHSQPTIGMGEIPPWRCSIRGEAIVVDLGVTELIAILRNFRDNVRGRLDLCRMALAAYGLGSQSVRSLNALSRKQGRVAVPPLAIPTFITFTDRKRPSSVVVLRPQEFPSTLSGAALAGVWVELTDEPVTTGVITKVPAAAAVIKSYTGAESGRPGVFLLFGPDLVQPLGPQTTATRERLRPRTSP
jgi:hypothetical protein